MSTRNIFANAAPHMVKDILPNAVCAGFIKRFEGRALSISLLSATLRLDRPPAEFCVSSYSTMLVPDRMERLSNFRQGTPLFGADPENRVPVMCVVGYGQIDSGLGRESLNPMNIVCADRLENWAGLDKTDHRARRDAWLSALIAALDAEWPGLAGAVKATEISTTRTRCTNISTRQVGRSTALPWCHSKTCPNSARAPLQPTSNGFGFPPLIPVSALHRRYRRRHRNRARGRAQKTSETSWLFDPARGRSVAPAIFSPSFSCAGFSNTAMAYTNCRRTCREWLLQNTWPGIGQMHGSTAL